MTAHFSDIKGKHVIVTGGSKGIGRDVAIEFAKLGASVVITGRDENALIETKSELSRFSSPHNYIVADMREVTEVIQMVDEAAGLMGGIDILVNNAGVNLPKSAFEVTEEDWDSMIDTNLKGSFFCSQQVGRYMLKQKKGKIINIVSQMAFVGYFKRAPYCASKGGAVQLTKALAVEWASQHINVNAVAPTFIETELTKQMLEESTFREDVINRIPLGKLARPRDVTGAVIYLASNMADFITGETIKVDGGWTAI
ncbi:SDR family NAD(P)-dependent oxidoreductase [Halobacillus aidingensis]|uniref:2-deoxy-D-gluconate 3-dehydrogenase n=1 Tax=Halobacillus aidingensis TaxID=240303 RepID=A0A1H0QM20_HALAD|nr:SDR family oxidoreductase [Halobacillus aidingensis]SDP18377.1 2-deoxy-D-gluconate 3-dehydrogenase [Halobacillus aidingensis]